MLTYVAFCFAFAIGAGELVKHFMIKPKTKNVTNYDV